MAYEETTPLPYYPPSPRCFLLLRRVRAIHTNRHTSHTHSGWAHVNMSSIPRSSLRIQNPRDSPGGPDGGQAHCAHIELQSTEGVGTGDTTANDSGEQTRKQAHTSSSSPIQTKMHVCATRRSLCCDKARVHKTAQTNKRARTNALTRKQPSKRASTVTPPPPKAAVWAG
jgi:hypothetical protein